MDKDSTKLRKHLKEAGLSDPVIDAAWPVWWSDDASESDAARAELRFTVAKRLGLSAKSLVHDEVKFIWRDDARFKSLTNQSEGEKSALTSFGLSVARLVLSVAPSLSHTGALEAGSLRKAILANNEFVDLRSLLGTCWAIGIPVIHLRVFPLAAKRMHAMAVKVGEQHVILLGKDSEYPAPAAFTLAHELGHVFLKHFNSSQAIIDLEMSVKGKDPEEDAADRYALKLLLGSERPTIQTNMVRYNAPMLAAAVLDYGISHQIDPGALALCLGYEANNWPVAMASLRYLYNFKKPVWQEVNLIAEKQLAIDQLSDDSARFLRSLMGMPERE